MSGDVLGTHFGGFLVPTGFESSFALETVRFIPVFLVYSSFSGFLWFFSFLWFFWFLGEPVGNLGSPAPVSISHSGLLIWTKGVLQGISGRALWVVR